MYSYEYPRLAITVDLCIFAYDSKFDVNILTIKRKNEPFKDKLCLPGGYIETTEKVKEAALRELKEETGLVIKDNELMFAGYFDELNRDPRERVITFAFTALLSKFPEINAGDDALECKWYKLGSVADSNLWGFDHFNIFSKSFNHWFGD